MDASRSAPFLGDLEQEGAALLLPRVRNGLSETALSMMALETFEALADELEAISPASRGLTSAFAPSVVKTKHAGA